MTASGQQAPAVAGPTLDPAALLHDLVGAPAAVLARHGAAIPELVDLQGCPQPVNHHAEGNVWNHTGLALQRLETLDQAVAQFAGEQLEAAGVWPLQFPRRTLDQALAVLLHDVAKPVTRQGADGSWTYYGHDRIGAGMALRLIDRLDLVAAASRAGLGLHPPAVAWLIREHLFWLNTDLAKVTDRAVGKRFLRDDGRGEDLRVLAWCDTLGSIGPDGRPHVDLIVAAERRIRDSRDRAAAAVARPDPVLGGTVVMEALALQPGRRVGAVLAWVRSQTTDEARARALLTDRGEWLRAAPLEELRAKR